MTRAPYSGRRTRLPSRRLVRPAVESLEERCLLALFVVNSPDDPGTGVCDVSECTLRSAILAANAAPDLDDVQFKIGNSGAVTIALKQPLPQILAPVSLDATTQPGFAGSPLVELNGAFIRGASGLVINTIGATIRGLAINQFDGNAIVLQGGGSHTVAGNTIGLRSGSSPVLAGNGGNGLLLLDSANNTIGGTTGADANLIVASGSNGIAIQSGSDNLVVGNLIGTTIDRSRGLGNGAAGIFLLNASGNQLGGVSAGEKNIIGFNGGDGVFVASGAGNQIIGNAIFENGGLGIDLGPDGPNDPQDPDPGLGANDLQNFPVITAATGSTNQLHFLGTLNSAPATTYTIAFYANGVADPSGFGEGDRLLGTVTASTDAAGFAKLDGSLAATATAGSIITATATAPNGDTSEFSAGIALTEPTFQFEFASYSVGESAGVAQVTVLRTNGLAGPFTVDVATNRGNASAGLDYRPVSQTLLFPSGVSAVVVDVSVFPDALDESDETVELDLSAPGSGANLGSPATTVLTIVDDDPTPTLSINDVSVIEGDAGPVDAVFTVSLSAVSGQDVTFIVATADNSAQSPSDYFALPATAFTIPAGTASTTVTVRVNGDTQVEKDEAFFVDVSAPKNALVSRGRGTGTIVNDDPKFDLNVRAFLGVPAAPDRLEIDYEIVGVSVPSLEFAFFTSNDARFDAGDIEQPPRLVISNPADLTIGLHTVRIDGVPYRSALVAMDTPFFVTNGRGVDPTGLTLAETDSTNNDISFIGLFHEPGSPLVIRGKDDSDRYADSPDDNVRVTGGAVLTISADILPAAVSIATGSVSEIRVLGLGGDDRIEGDASVSVPMVVRAGAGNDTVTGGRAGDTLAGDSGDDRLGGRLGNDLIDGGPGADIADFSVATHGVVANLATGRARGQGRDDLRGVEDLQGSSGRDRLTGNDAANVLRGGGGNDIIAGGAGNDTLGGGDGNDSLFGEAGNDLLDGDAGNDLVCGGDGGDAVAGSAGDDTLDGGNDNDDIRGGDGRDLACGGAGDDVVAGDAGNDAILGDSGIDQLLGGADFDTIVFGTTDLPVDLGGVGRDGGKLIRFGD